MRTDASVASTTGQSSRSPTVGGANVAQITIEQHRNRYRLRARQTTVLVINEDDTHVQLVVHDDDDHDMDLGIDGYDDGETQQSTYSQAIAQVSTL